jgi:hypothetical protein
VFDWKKERRGSLLPGRESNSSSPPLDDWMLPLFAESIPKGDYHLSADHSSK